MTRVFDHVLALAPLYTWWNRRYWAAREAAATSGAGLTPAVVITGGSRGIGLALAQRFAEAGWHIVLVARRSAPLAEAADQLQARGFDRLSALSLDITADDAPLRLETALANERLYLDVLVNCAGIGAAGPFHRGDPDHLVQLATLNVTAVTRLTRSALPAMLERGRGGVLNVGSIGGFVPGPHQATYFASKAYIASFTLALAHETAGQGVRMCLLAPGPVATRFHSDMGADGSVYRLLLPEATPDQVARAAFRGFQLGHQIVTPGVIATLLAVMARVLPHFITVPIVGLLLRTGNR